MTNGGLKQQEYFTPVLEAGNLKSRCWQGPAPKVGCHRESPLCLPAPGRFNILKGLHLHMAFSLSVSPLRIIYEDTCH